VFFLSRHKAVAIISREIEDLKKKRSFVQLAIDAVKAREEGIKNIKEMLQYFSKSADWEKSNELCEEVVEILNAHRILSLNAVESIIKWKEQLVYALILNKTDSIGKHKELEFIWEDQNYIIKMRNDIDFLYGSDFSKIFNFSELPDPMLIVPSKPLEKKVLRVTEHHKYIQIPPMLLKRVKLAEDYILDRDREIPQSKSGSSSGFPRPSKRMDEKVANKILEIIIEETCENDLSEVSRKIYNQEINASNEKTIKQVRGNLIDETTSLLAEEIANQVYLDSIDPHIKKHLDGIVNKYIDDELDKNLKAIVKDEIKNSKSYAKDAVKNEKKNKKEKEAAEKKKKEEALAMEKQLAAEREEKERQRKIAEALKKQIEEENKQLTRILLENLLGELHFDLENLAQVAYQEESDIKAKQIEVVKPAPEPIKSPQVEVVNPIPEPVKPATPAPTVQNEKLNKLIVSQLAEQITRILIEDEINKLNINFIAESELNQAFEAKKLLIQSEIEKKALQDRENSILNDKLSDLIYKDLFEDILEIIKFEKIPEKMIEKITMFRSSISVDTKNINNVSDPMDYAVDEFTPGEHSPIHYEPSEENKKTFEAKDSLKKNDELIYDYAGLGEFTDLNGLEWVPIGLSEESIEEIINDYYSCLSETMLSVLPTVPQLLLEVCKGIDCCWYWGLQRKKILGCLIFSLDHLSTDRKLIIHHASCIDPGLFANLMESAIKFLFEEDTSEEVRINLLVPIGTELPRDIKKIFTSLGFKWKASADSGVAGSDLNVMGKTRAGYGLNPNARKGDINSFKLKGLCVIEPSDKKVPVNDTISEEMIQIGNRQCQVNSVLNLFGKLDKSGIQLSNIMTTRLQREISDILEIINSTDSFNFPDILSLVTDSPADAIQLIQQKGFNGVAVPPKSSVSILEINFKFVGCSHITERINGLNYRFIRFKSSNILVGSEFSIYSIPTSLNYIRAVFIYYEDIIDELRSELRRDKTDLYYKVESMLKSVTYQSHGIHAFTVPAFSKKVDWTIPWIQGYEVLPQRDEKASRFVKNCFESVTFSVEAPAPAAGSLNLEKTKGEVFSTNFIFCLTHTGLDRVLDMPLFVSLIEPKDWIAS
jgi:hypothetical protein